MHVLRTTRLNSSNDSWSCELDSNGQFSVTSCKRRLIKSNSGSYGNSFLWLKEVPTKVSCFVWRVVQNYIPSGAALKNRGINITSSMCGECSLKEETIDNLLCVCVPLCQRYFGNEYWDDVVSRCPYLIRQLKYWNLWYHVWIAQKRKKGLVGICYGTIWCL